MALFNKAIHKLTSYIQVRFYHVFLPVVHETLSEQKLLEKEIVESSSGSLNDVQPAESGKTIVPGAQLPIKSFEEELDDGAAVVRKALQRQYDSAREIGREK